MPVRLLRHYKHCKNLKKDKSMQLHDLKPTQSVTRKKTRIGRGGKRGTTAGRGTKGQKARAGHRIRPAERDYIQRLPKLRGFKNPSRREKHSVINLTEISKKLEGDVIEKKTLVKSRLISVKAKRIKILGSGEVSRAFIVKDVELSTQAKAKIESAGGKIEA
jgi:large subunit ribosomal protein L15